MAKQSRGGLGRGLNALLGGYEEVSPAPRQRETIKEEAPVQEPVREVVEAPQPVVEAPVEPVAETPVATPAPAGVIIDDKEQIVAEDNVTIKSVASRVATPATRVAPPAPEKAVEKKEEPRTQEEVDINLVQPNPNQPRTNFKKDELEELASSIERNGLLQPILVRTMEDGTYQIIAGERRWQACKSIGMKKVPVRVREADENEVLELALIENIQRSDLNPIEEAYGYKRIMERQNLTQAELAQMLSKGRSTIANALRLLDLPEDAQQLLFEEKITAGHARAILSLSSKEARQKLTEKMIAEKISVREAENIARLLENKPSPSSSAPRTPTPKSFKAVARSLRKNFETNVRVKTVQGKNKIEIEFKDEEDLERIFKMMVKED